MLLFCCLTECNLVLVLLIFPFYIIRMGDSDQNVMREKEVMTSILYKCSRLFIMLFQQSGYYDV